MQLNPTVLWIKRVVRHLIVISLSETGTQVSLCIPGKEVSVVMQYFLQIFKINDNYLALFSGLLTNLYSAGILFDFTTEIFMYNSKYL